MANGAIRLTWRDRNWAEQGHYIYRSQTPMNVNNLPNPIDTLDGNVTEYIDYDVITDQTYYYRIGAYRNNDVMISDEIEVVANPSTIDIHDVFGDGSAIATYLFDGNTNDISNNTSISLPNHSFVEGVSGQAIDCNSSTDTKTFSGLDNLFGSPTGFACSMWIFHDPFTENTQLRIMSLGTDTNNQSSIGVNYDRLYIADTTNTNYDSDITLVDNQWNHACWSFNVNDNTITFMLNGVDNTKSISNSLSVDTPMYFSAWSRGDYRFKGFLDQLRIFNRPLSLDEMKFLYDEIDTPV